MKKIVAVVVAAAFLATAGIGLAAEQKAAPAKPGAPAAAPAAPAAPPKPPPPVKVNQIGMEAPVWEAKAFDSETMFKSEQYKGKPYAIVFLNSACASCREEVGSLMNLELKPDFTLILAATDAKADRVTQTYREQLKTEFPIIGDPKFLLARKFGISFTPASVIIGKDGKLQAWHVGYTDENKDEIAKAFEKYLK